VLFRSIEYRLVIRSIRFHRNHKREIRHGGSCEVLRLLEVVGKVDLYKLLRELLRSLGCIKGGSYLYEVCED
jgi:hypothetical protein